MESHLLLDRPPGALLLRFIDPELCLSSTRRSEGLVRLVDADERWIAPDGAEEDEAERAWPLRAEGRCEEAIVLLLEEDGRRGVRLRGAGGKGERARRAQSGETPQKSRPERVHFITSLSPSPVYVFYCMRLVYSTDTNLCLVF